MYTCALCTSYSEDKYRIVYEDDFVFVMVNNSPLKDGHVMVLPIRHAETLSELTPQEAQAFLRITDECMRISEKLYGDAAISVVNGWKHRSEPHLHLHVVPSKHNLRGLLVASEGIERRVLGEESALREIAHAFSVALKNS